MGKTKSARNAQRMRCDSCGDRVAPDRIRFMGPRGTKVCDTCRQETRNAYERRVLRELIDG